MHRPFRQGQTIQDSGGGVDFIYNEYGTGDKRKREDSDSFELPPSEEHPPRKKDKPEVGR